MSILRLKIAPEIHKSSTKYTRRNIDMKILLCILNVFGHIISHVTYLTVVYATSNNYNNKKVYLFNE